MIEGLAVGRIVHVDGGDGCVPAIVIKVWDVHNGTCNLSVFMPDGSIQLRTSVMYDAEQYHGPYWHYPERV